VVPDPKNRDGKYPNADDVIENAEEHNNAGYVSTLCRAICVEMPDSEDERLIIYVHNERGVAKDPDRLPQVAQGFLAAGGMGMVFLSLATAAVTSRQCAAYRIAHELLPIASRIAHRIVPGF